MITVSIPARAVVVVGAEVVVGVAVSSSIDLDDDELVSCLVLDRKKVVLSAVDGVTSKKMKRCNPHLLVFGLAIFFVQDKMAQ